MGALQVEVKVLEKKPLLFAWENKHNHQVESYLVTCECQKLGLKGATEDDKKSSSIFQGGDVVWASKLAHALDISEVVSLASLEPCVTVGYGMEHTSGIEKADNKRRRNKKREILLSKMIRAKQPSKKKRKKLDHCKKGGYVKKVVKDRHVDFNSVIQEQTVVTTEAKEEQTQSESQKSMQEELPLSAECSEGQTDPEESNRNNENSTVDVTKDSGSNEEVTNSKPVGVDMNNASKESLDCTFSDSNYDNEESNVHEVLVHTEDGSTSKKEEYSNGSRFNSNKVIPTALQLCVPDGAATAITKDQTTITQVTSSSNLAIVPVSEEEAVMSAISSMMDIYPVAVIDVSQTEQAHIKLAEGTNEQINQKRDEPDFISTLTEEEKKNMTKFLSDKVTFRNQKRCKAEFIRTLTEEERKNMFKFQSDIDEENLKKFQEGGRFFLCEHCGKVVSLHRQTQHMKIHSGLPRAKDFTCNQCGKNYVERSSLYRHIRRSHRSEPEKRIECRYCSMTFMSFKGRTSHERAHFNVFAGVCSGCGYRFVDVTKFKAHITRGCTGRLNRYKRTTTCNICRKVLCTDSMPAHLDMHAGKMYTCPICNKSVKFRARYLHMRIHSEERNYVCDVCNKSFKTSGVLKTHMRIHTGERPVKCRYCEKSFSSHQGRNLHERIHTHERPFSCTICNKRWKRRKGYMAHMKKHHPGVPVNYKKKSAMMNQQMLLQEQTEKQDNLKPKEPS